ncbi:MAG: lysophospholipid acyltransferase family protein, partial [Bacteroidota bacterium]
MRTFLSYLLTPIHIAYFGFFLLLFHPLQWIGLRVGGYIWQKRAIDYLNFFLYHSLWLLGVRPIFHLPYDLPTDRPLLVIANHQSMYDIPAFFWKLRKHHVKFVAKMELAKGVPSISFNLRHGGNAVIDRTDPRQALPELKRFATYIEEHNYCACIFPEGTRSR